MRIAFFFILSVSRYAVHLRQIAKHPTEYIMALVKAQYEKAMKILEENKNKLDERAKYFYEKESIAGEIFMSILNA